MGIKKIKLFFFFVFAWIVGAAQPVNADLSGEKYQMINGSVDYLQTNSLIPIDSVLKPESQKRFKRLGNKGIIYSGYEPYYYWYRFTISNNTSSTRNLVLLFGGLGVREAEIWQKEMGEWKYAGVTGYQYPLEKRPYRYAHPAFPLTLQANTTDTFLLKIDESHAYKVAVFVLTDMANMKIFEHRFYFMMGIIVGLLLLFALFNLYLFFSIKENIHLWYFGYIACMLLFTIKDEGLDPEFLGLDSANGYRLTSMLAISGLAIFFLLQMVQAFLINIRKSSLLYKSTSLVKWLLLFAAAVQFVVFYFQASNEIEYVIFHVTNKVGLVAILIVLISSIYSYRKGFKPAIFMLAGQVVFLIGAVLRSLFIAMENHVFPPSAFEVGLLIEVIVISYGLMYRYNRYKKQKEDLALELQEEKLKATREILNTQEQEQKRIAADLHDELGGNLAAIKMTLQSFNLPGQQNETLNYLIDTASNNARHIAHNLMPPDFENTSLKILLDKFYQQVNTEGKINFHFFDSGNNGRFNKQEELMIYRIIMELTNNVIKHSKATEATIQLVYHEKQLTLMAEDNGQGMSPESEDGIGLKSIRLRVNFFNGNLNVDTSKNGTTILIQIPYAT